jgi:hypothetical protein
MKLLKTGIVALSLTVTATAALAADYEIFADIATVETWVNHYAVERLNAPRDPAFRRIRPAKECREGCQTGLADCQCSALGKSTRLPEKLSSVFQTLLSAWR